jgi:septal ring factor EnvC (AmiA/AmiB activator)
MRFAIVFLALPFLAAASAPVEQGVSLNAEIQAARAEEAAAEAEAARLERAAGQAKGEAARFQAEQAAAAQAIEAAEARITAADSEARLASAYVAAHQRLLAQQQRPVASLLAGLAVMAERPPLLALADEGSVDDLVKVRILLDSTLPVIRRRTEQLSAELAEGQRLQQSAAKARAEIVSSRQVLAEKRQQFAALEQRALAASVTAGGQALSAGDVALAAGEDVERMRGAEASGRSAMALATELAAAGPAPARPTAADGPARRLPFAYALPAAAPVTDGLGTVNASGVQSRGITLATTRGLQLAVPAAGVIRYSGPFRDYDGIVIIDHGGGWMSLIINLSSPLRSGAKVSIGEVLGNALGPVEIELSQNGRRISPALIAGSSPTLSKANKGG